jgi:hypothetical protein
MAALIGREGNSLGKQTLGHQWWLEGQRGSTGYGGARGRGWVIGGGRWRVVDGELLFSVEIDGWSSFKCFGW